MGCQCFNILSKPVQRQMANDFIQITNVHTKLLLATLPYVRELVVDILECGDATLYCLAKYIVRNIKNI